jgi:Spy/CpxP family protein refolding chaperone
MIGHSRQRWVGVAVLAATFLAGGIAGAAVRASTANPTPAVNAQRGEDQQRDENNRRRFPYEHLGIEGEQRAQLEALFERRRDELSALWHEYEPRMDAVVDSTRAEMHRLLTPEQIQAYDEYRKQRKQRQDSARSGSDRDNAGR